MSLAIFHPHFSIRILSSAFFYPHFIIRTFLSAFYHPHFSIRILSSAIRHPPSAIRHPPSAAIRSALYRDPYFGSTKRVWKPSADLAVKSSLSNQIRGCQTVTSGAFDPYSTVLQRSPTSFGDGELAKIFVKKKKIQLK